MKTTIGAALALALAAGAPPALAHGGGLNAEGCHNNRKTGDYHCHRGGSGSAKSARSRQTAKPIGVVSGGSRQGAYANCSAARADGRSNIRRGEPGYGSHLDRDDDGVACER